MKLYCSFVRRETLDFIFQNDRREDHGRERSRRPQAPSSRISPEEEAAIIEERGRIVGAQAGSNLEQIILHEEDQREKEINRAKEILGDPERLQSLLPESTYEASLMVDRMLELIKDDVPFLKQIINLYIHHDAIDYGRICTSAIQLMPDDETFFQGMFDAVDDTNFQLACSLKIHDQNYLKSTVEEYRLHPNDQEENRGSVAIQRITDQRYIANIATDNRANLPIRQAAIEMLTDRGILQRLLNRRNQLPGSRDARDDIRHAVEGRLEELSRGQ